MSALTEKIAAEHLERIEGGTFGDYYACSCGDWSSVDGGTGTYGAHLAEVTEAAVRESIAGEQEDYADATYDLVDTNNGARLAFIELVHIAREGRGS